MATDIIAGWLRQTVNPDAASRKAAEEELARAKLQPQYTLTLLQLLTEERIELPVRQAGAVFFKNLVKQHWAPEDETAFTIQGDVKAQVREGLLRLILFVPERLQAQLSEALALVAKHDFPAQWPTLLPEVVSQIEASIIASPKQYHQLDGLLKIAHSIFMRYRHEFKSDALFTEIKYVLQHFQAPLLKLMQLSLADLTAVASDAKASTQLLGCVTLIATLHYDLAFQDLPEYFEDHIKEWMACFVEALKYTNPHLVVDDEQSAPGPMSVLQAEVVECLELYMSKYEEEFQPFIESCLSQVWGLLMATGLHPHQDLLVTTSIRFLTTVSTSVHHHFFASPQVLQNVCEKIITPNVQLLEQDEELFEDNAFEYIRRDVEGSDTDTRRRVSCDLVRGLCRNYEAQVTNLFSGYITSMLQQHAANPKAGWKAKDAAIYIVIALTLKGGTSKLGATQTNSLVNLGDFFSSHVLPELQAAAQPGGMVHPILLADAIKFVTVFRAQLPNEAFEPLLPLLAHFLSHKQPVVHTYAATAIERILAMKDTVPSAMPTAAKLRFSPERLAPFVQPLLTGLFGALKLPGSSENAYVMRAIMRVTVISAEGMTPYASVCIEELKSVLGRVCANPSNPTFNHLLFETLASLIRFICAKTPAAVDSFEAMLLPPFQYVLQSDVAEFTPYVFQILAQLLECRTSLSAGYESLFSPLLIPSNWERPGNIPALVRLICAYMSKGKAQVRAELERVLGVFQKLLASRATDQQACKLLSSIFLAFEGAELQAYFRPIFDLVLKRLQSNKKVSVHVISTWAIFIARYGTAAFKGQLESIQPGLYLQIMRAIWAEHAGFTQNTARKTVCISTLKLLTETELIQDQAAFGTVLQALITMVLADQGMAAAPAISANDIPDIDENDDGNTGYSAAFAQLHFASVVEVDPYQGEAVPSFLVGSLARLNSATPGVLPHIVGGIVQSLPADKQVRAYGTLVRALQHPCSHTRFCLIAHPSVMLSSKPGCRAGNAARNFLIPL